MVEELSAYDIEGVPIEHAVIGRGPTYRAVHDELLHRRVSGMESHAVPVAHGLHIQCVVEPAEQGVVGVTDYEHDLGGVDVTVHEGPEIGRELGEVLHQVRVTVYHDNDGLPGAYLLEDREKILDVVYDHTLPTVLRNGMGHLLEVVLPEAIHTREVDVVLVPAELSDEGRLAEMPASAYRTRHGHLLIDRIQIPKFLCTTHKPIHETPYRLWRIKHW